MSAVGSAPRTQQLVFEVQRRIPAGRSQIEMTPYVKAFRARLKAEMGEATAKGWFVDFTPEFVAPRICLHAEPPAGGLTT